MSAKAPPSFKEAFPGLILIGLILWGGWFFFFRDDPAPRASESATAPISADSEATAVHSVSAHTAVDDLAPVPAIIDRSDLVFSMTEDHNIRLVATDPEEPISVYVRDMRPQVTRFVLCPEADTMLRVRTAIGSNDIQAVSLAAEGEGCFLASDGHGPVVAVHVQNFVRVRFNWLAGNDFDTGAEERLEYSGREYWAISSQVGTMHRNERIEPLIRVAFE